MDRIKVYLFPGYVGIPMVAVFSPTVYKFLTDQGVELEVDHWGGTIESLPKESPVLIRASSQMVCSPQELATACIQLGHFLFYDDQLIQPDGTFTKKSLIEALTAFLDTRKKIMQIGEKK